jgi:hypothetical protein
VFAEARVTHRVWSPLVDLTRRRHLTFRRELEGRPLAPNRALTVLSAGV